METHTFFQLLCQEIRENPNLYPYYKLNQGGESRRIWRKAYYMQRLEYINSYIDRTISHPQILDCGCGYGSTCLFLAMNGISTRGTTLEYYIDQIETRKKYWNQFGDSQLFFYEYENLFDNPPMPESLDYIILQDTLHHIEPVEEGLNLLYRGLKKGGKLILVEINGACLLQSFIFFLKRGNHRVREIYDEKLGKKILLGDENFRSEKQWQILFSRAGFFLSSDSVKYIRYLLPFSFTASNEQEKIKKEKTIAARFPLLKKYAYFGLNMMFSK
jgi:SAM-dependent methyltransferase